MELSNCSFYGHVTGDGGSIDISENNDAILTQCKFIANSAVGDGGAIRSSKSKLSLIETTFINNSGAFGGALNSQSSKIEINFCYFQKNMATRGSGGVIYGRRHTAISIKD